MLSYNSVSLAVLGTSTQRTWSKTLSFDKLEVKLLM